MSCVDCRHASREAGVMVTSSAIALPRPGRSRRSSGRARTGAAREPAPTVILVVSDDPAMRARVSACLRQQGHEVCIAHGCAEAQRIAGERRTIGLVLGGPGLGLAPGLDFIRWFRSASPTTPVLVLHRSLTEMNRCLLEFGPVAVLLRPVTLTQLACAVGRLMPVGTGGRVSAGRLRPAHESGPVDPCRSSRK